MAGAKQLPGEDRRPDVLHDFISRHIVRAIITGGLGPGEKLSPTRLAAELGISHIPVREALAALEASGHIVREPRRGFFVAELSPDDIEDVYHWRAVLEDEAHRMAVPLLDSSDLARMRKINRALERADPYTFRYLDLNRQLHFVVFERAGSEHLLRFLNPLWDASIRYQGLMSTVDLPSAVLRCQHNDLIDACAAKDVERVNAIMKEHRGVTLG